MRWPLAARVYTVHQEAFCEAISLLLLLQHSRHARPAPVPTQRTNTGYRMAHRNCDTLPEAPPSASHWLVKLVCSSVSPGSHHTSQASERSIILVRCSTCHLCNKPSRLPRWNLSYCTYALHLGALFISDVAALGVRTAQHW